MSKISIPVYFNLVLDSGVRILAKKLNHPAVADARCCRRPKYQVWEAGRAMSCRAEVKGEVAMGVLVRKPNYLSTARKGTPLQMFAVRAGFEHGIIH